MLLLQEKLPEVQFSIIFNSSAAKCCVSQKDAEYRTADAVVQFGRTCLTPVARLSVLRVPAPRWRANVPSLCQGLRSFLQENQLDNDNKRIIVLYDTRCAYAMGAVEQELRPEFPNIMMSRLLISQSVSPDTITTDSTVTIDPIAAECLVDVNEKISQKRSQEWNFLCFCPSDYSLGVCNFCYGSSFGSNVRKINEIARADFLTTSVCENGESFVNISGRIFRLPNRISKDNIVFIFIGHQSPTLTSLSLKLATFPLYVIHPETGAVVTATAQKMVMQRNYKIEQIRDAQKICLLISNFSLPRYNDIVTQLSILVKKSGKKLFVQYSAHPDLPKLMNVPGIDVFVYIACPESSVIEREIDPDLYKMMATPWELEVALNPNREWKLDFETDFSELLACNDHQTSTVSNVKGVPPDTDQYSVSVSLLSNKTQSLGIAPTIEVTSESIAGALVAVPTRQVAQRLQAGRALGLLKGEVPWYGLDPTISAASDGGCVEGRKGVAGGYSQEGS
ncbi:2-(3-amino-3-carboxypropyl)histidine synthase subunit 2 isoform X2 [Hyalella azteca]|nr:2-(3-amino-3-carboxypropyl)histidine synthase subunit 2 isoform X2 [Hyalella azteca]